METHVLIPHPLILKVRPSANCSSPSVAKLLEQQVSVTTTLQIPKGWQIHPAQGTLRCGKLEVYSTLNHDNIHACYDSIDTEDSNQGGKRVRRCAWTRFLTFSHSLNTVNLRCTKNSHTGQLVYETTENIAPNTDLICSYIPADAAQNEQQQQVAQLKRAMEAIIKESPLDLSLPLIFPHPRTSSSPMSPSSSSSLYLEDRVSISSDSGLSSSEESVTQTPPSPPPTPTALMRSSKKPQSASSPRNAKKMLPCSFCGKCFDRPSLLNRHLRTHTGERPHVCDICEKGFSTSSSLNTHRRIHSGEKPHECATCGKRFTASSNLYYHRMTHVKEKPHKCELCQKSFPTPGDLKSHMYIHNGSWPHRCHICDRGFSKVTNLKNHLFLHTGQKPHECHVCGKRFALGCNMKAHLKTHDRGNVKIEDPSEELLNVTD